MLLSPQHFQELVQRQDSLLHYNICTMSPFYWGVQHMQIDHGLLVSGIFRVIEMEAIMPDGMVVSYGFQGENALEVDLTPHSESMKQSPQFIHLVLPAKKPGEASFKGDLPRFDSIEGKGVLDENTGDNELLIPRLRPRLSLLVTDNPPQKYVSFPLAQVSYSNESFSLTDYIPPTLRVPVQSPIGTMCSQVAKRLREKAVFLSYEVLAPSSTSGMPLVLETKTLIQTMVAALPMFEAVISTGVSHPYHVYLALCSLVGNLASLGTLVPPVLNPYNHNDIRSSFEQAQQYVFRMIDEGISEAFTSIPFYFENEMYGTQFDATWMDRPIYLGVRGQVGMTEKEVIGWIEKSWIGSESKIQSMRDKRILGPERKRIERVEELVPARGVILFALKIDPEYIIPNEKLNVYNTSSIGDRPTEIVMYVKKKADV